MSPRRAAKQPTETDVERCERELAEARAILLSVTAEWRDANALTDREGILRSEELEQQLSIERKVVQRLDQNLKEAKRIALAEAIRSEVAAHTAKTSERVELVQQLRDQVAQAAETLASIDAETASAQRLMRRVQHLTGADGRLHGESIEVPAYPAEEGGLHFLTYQRVAVELRSLHRTLTPEA